MSRGLDRDDIDRDQKTASQNRLALSHGRGGGAASAAEHLRQQQRPPHATRSGPRPESRRRQEVPLRDRVLNLSEAELHTMRDIGRFRTVGEDDLLRFRYQGNASKLHRDYLNLRALGLVERRTISVGKTRKPLPVYTLTREGKKVVKNARLDPSGQALYAGFVKPREAAHDAAIYRMFQAEAARIEAQGGRVNRVVLDFELKKKVYSELAKAHGLGALEYAERQAEIAAASGLSVVDGKIPLPDLRIEYETADGEQARIDLELATEHYHRGRLAEKARAGFKMYGFTSTSRGSRADWEGREITAGILAL
jgi:hypothetical protein